MNHALSQVKFSVKKLIGFALIYMSAAVLFEAIIIVGFSIQGYDVLHGVMPEGEMITRIPLYGMVGFTIMTILYVIYIEKRHLADMGIEWNKRLILSFLKGTAIGAALVVGFVAFLIVRGMAEYDGVGKMSISSLLLWGLAYAIQSLAEEVMCRGFLQTSLSQKVKPQIAILLSSVAFTVPHASGICEIGGWNMVAGFINVVLVSWVFSLAFIKEKSLGAPFGLHFGWNYCLGVLLGLGLTGESVTEGIIHVLVNPTKTLYTGGVYGIEASVLLIPVLIMVLLIYYWNIRRGGKHGV